MEGSSVSCWPGVGSSEMSGAGSEGGSVPSIGFCGLATTGLMTSVAPAPPFALALPRPAAGRTSVGGTWPSSAFFFREKSLEGLGDSSTAAACS